MFSQCMNIGHCTSCARKLLNTYTHLTRRFPLCKARRWAQRHTGTSSRIPPLLAAVHQHTHMACSHGHGVHASLSATPQPALGRAGGRTEGYYTIWGADLIETTERWHLTEKSSWQRQTDLYGDFRTLVKQIFLLHQRVGYSFLVVLSVCVEGWGSLRTWESAEKR